MTDVERAFVDTNVLLSASDVSRATHSEAIRILEQGEKGTPRLYVCGQVLREYLVVATRPTEVNGLGMSSQQACRNIQLFRKLLQILDETHESHLLLEELILRHSLSGKRIHDANLIAVMNVNGLNHLKTWNPQDFRVFEGVILI